MGRLKFLVKRDRVTIQEFVILGEGKVQRYPSARAIERIAQVIANDEARTVHVLSHDLSTDYYVSPQD